MSFQWIRVAGNEVDSLEIKTRSFDYVASVL